MCYTSGTTGNPKGVVYSHRSTWLHSLAVTSGAAYAVDTLVGLGARPAAIQAEVDDPEAALRTLAAE